MSSSARGCEFSVRYVWNGAKARFRWNSVLPARTSDPIIPLTPSIKKRLLQDINSDHSILSYLVEISIHNTLLLINSLSSFISSQNKGKFIILSTSFLQNLHIAEMLLYNSIQSYPHYYD